MRFSFNVGNLLSVGEPILLLTSGQVRWKVPILYGLPSKGLLGHIGELLLDVETGEILLSESTPSSIEDLEKRAEQLYHTTASTASISISEFDHAWRVSQRLQVSIELT